LRKSLKAVAIRCSAVCRFLRHFPFTEPHTMGRPRKLVRHWPLAIAAMIAFGLALFISGEHVGAGVLFGRVTEAFGDLLLDRGIA